MRVRVLFFGMLKDLVGKASDTLDLDQGASVADLLAHYETQIPQLRESLPSLALAVNQEYASAETKLRSNDEVAILPPVSGGKDGSRIASASTNVSWPFAPAWIPLARPRSSISWQKSAATISALPAAAR